MYAIIEDSGTQFKVTTGDTIRIDRQVGEDEKTVTFDRVLFVGGEGEPKIGAPVLSGATVTAEVVGAQTGPKVTTVKHKRRKGYYKRIGHRQKFTAVKISAINA
jgi:large subunit ribosomal protein L21